MNRCVVTGGTGLVGYHLVDHLCDTWSVCVVSRGKWADWSGCESVRHVRLDFTRRWNEDELPEKVDAVIHLVQSEYFREFPERAMEIFETNTSSTVRMLDYARKAGASTFILASSGGVYGYGDREFSEDTKIVSRGDLGFYLGTKLCSEIVSDCFTDYMHVVALRFFFVYGPGQRSTMLIPRLVASVKEERPIVLHGHDGIRLNPTYVDDVVGAIVESLVLKTSQKINVGGPEILSMRQLGEVIGQVVGKKPIFEMKEGPKPQSIVGDIKKMARLLHRPNWHFQDGVARYVKNLKKCNSLAF